MGQRRLVEDEDALVVLPGSIIARHRQPQKENLPRKDFFKRSFVDHYRTAFCQHTVVLMMNGSHNRWTNDISNLHNLHFGIGTQFVGKLVSSFMNLNLHLLDMFAAGRNPVAHYFYRSLYTCTLGCPNSNVRQFLAFLKSLRVFRLQYLESCA